MCGGAIISDFIPTARSRQVTDADLLWPNLKKGGSKKKRGSRRCAVEETEDNFEAYFQEFDDESGESEENDEVDPLDVQLSAFPPKGRLQHVSGPVVRGRGDVAARSIRHIIFPPENTFSRFLIRVPPKMRSCNEPSGCSEHELIRPRRGSGNDPTEQELERWTSRVLYPRVDSSKGSGNYPTEQELGGWTGREGELEHKSWRFSRENELGHKSWGFSRGVNSGTNPGDLAEGVNSGTNPGDLAERANSSTNPRDLVERANSGINPGYLAEGELAAIRERYSIPTEYGLHVLQSGQHPYGSDAPGMCISVDALEVGLRFLLHPLIEECLRWWRISSSQVVPNSWRYLVVFLGECRGAGIIPTRDLFMACFRLFKSRGGYYLTARVGFRVSGAHSNNKGWKSRYLFMSGSVWGSRLDWSAHPIGNAPPYLSEEEFVLVGRLKGILSISCTIKEMIELWLVEAGLNPASRGTIMFALFRLFGLFSNL
ncbi:hypothetical protein B296_00028758 [Ensete ventricosum]|uniref:Transposase (putative) gypsy type domain-containing protein n=1 Tax=Ensete ventricosum TaxID=4639 RepID=A0A426ZUT0_ENSVE|nr:hypothetical protein B296_00028758 [Ensete ventricosum]